MPAQARGYRFGPFELDVLTAELRRDGTLVKLPPQPFAALQLLVSRAGELVTRDELREALWGHDNFVDFNAGLNFCIGQLRAALQDPAAESRLIVAVPRRGYRLIADVMVVENGDVRRAASRFERRRLIAAGIAAVAVLLLAGIVAWQVRAPRRAAVLERSLEALQKYERGISGLGDASPDELLARVHYFEVALKADPVWAEAWAGLAEAKLLIGNYRAEAPQVAYATAKAAAAKALAIDPDVGAAHTAYGAAALYFDWDWPTAASHLRRGVVLSPSSPRAHYWYSRYLSGRGDHVRALEQAKAAVALAPASPSLRTQLGMAQYYAGQFAAARSTCEEGLALMPEFLPARFCTSASNLELTTEPLNFWTARLERLQQARSDQELLDRTLSIAGTFVHAGNPSGALDVLEHAANRRADVLIFAGVHPALRSLSNEPRYRRILQRVGFN